MTLATRKPLESHQRKTQGNAPCAPARSVRANAELPVVVQPGVRRADFPRQAAEGAHRPRQDRAQGDPRGKEKIKPRAAYMKEAQSVFNSWVRERDADQPCMQLRPRHHQGKYDAGHYRSVGSNPALRFPAAELPSPVRALQSAQVRQRHRVPHRPDCQDRRPGGGLRLEGRHEPKHYSIDDLKAIKAAVPAEAARTERTGLIR